MNKPIRSLAVFCLVLFLALLLNVSYLQFLRADELNNRNDNRRARDAEFSRERGAILVAGDPVARSEESDDRFNFQRRYTQPFKLAHVTGFFSYIYGTSGVESNQNRVLSGEDPRLFVDRFLDVVSNTPPEGGSVSLTLDPAAQEAAFRGLQDLGPQTQGAVVALEPATGKVLAMASSPTYDPNLLASHDLDLVRESWERLDGSPAKPMQNRSIAEIYPPGSTFKLVTAAAALETGDYTPETLVRGGSRLDLPQTDTDLVNQGGSNCGGDRITLTQALMVSCNVSFGDLGMKLGDDALRETAQAFGFGQRYLSGLGGQAVSRFPEDLNAPQTAQSAIGQYDVAATPLQMALVAATVANNGQGMRPYVVDEVRAPDLSVLEKTPPEELPDRAMSPRSARMLSQMLVAVVEDGTGTSAQIPGIAVAGKTGTAQSDDERPDYAWFVSFAPADNPRVAVAVLVQNAGVSDDEISGGRLAAPIAKRVMEAVVNR